MANTRMKRLVAAAAAAALAATLAACGGDDSGSSEEPRSDDKKGGTLTILDIAGNYDATDPAGIYYGHQIANFRRLVYRSLVSFPHDEDPEVSGAVIPDLATDTGTTEDNGKSWSFTLKDDIKWEDGKDITCADFQYGVGRQFDSTINSTGPGAAYLSQLDLPTNADGEIDYPGPATATDEQQAAFEEAVACDGNKLTFNFSAPWADFPLSVAALFSTDPYRQDLDKGAANQWKVFSNGPYKIEGNTFDPDKGATFVRNENYDPDTDDPKLREANPDEIKITISTNTDAVFDRLVADSGADQAAYSTTNIPSTFYSQIQGPVAERAVESGSPYTRFLEINAQKMTDPVVRKALVVATPREGALKVLGGDHYGDIATTIVATNIPGFQENPAWADLKPNGDPEAAKALLNGQTPNIQYWYPEGNDLYPKLAAVLEEGWEKAGFVVDVKSVPADATPSWYAQMSEKQKDADVFWAGWAADWPSLLAVVPVILETDNPGFNYGYYSNEEVDKLIAEGKEAFAAGDTDGMISKLQEADKLAGEDAAYVPLLKQKNWFLHGSKVGGFLPTVAASYYPDLGGMYVIK